MKRIPNEDEEMQLTEREEALLEVLFSQHLNQITAAYTVYALLNPNSKKLVSKDLFLKLYDDNMEQFIDLMDQEDDSPQLSLFQ